MGALNFGKLIPWRHVATFVAGAILLALLIMKYSFDTISSQFLSLGPTFINILIVSFFYYFVQTLAWQITLSGHKVSFWGLFQIKVGADALDSLLPFSFVKGDSISTHQLRQRFGVQSGAESIATDNALCLLALTLFTFLGFIVGFLSLDTLHPIVRYGLPLLAAIKLVAYIIIVSTQQGFFSAVLAKVIKIGPLASPALMGQCREMDQYLKKMFTERKGAFYQALILRLLAFGLLTAEVYLIGAALIPGFTTSLALTLTAVIPVVYIIFYFVPGAFGILEASFASLLTATLGAPVAAAGITLGLVRRARAITWIIIGFIFMGNPFKMFFGK
jgi:glycosyltransferase 2 family protein